MDRIKTAKSLIKLAKQLLAEQDYMLDKKLSTMKSIQGIKNYIRNYVDDLVRGHFKDDDWRNVRNVFDKIKTLGVHVVYGATNGGYSVDGMSKTYDFEIDFINAYNKEIKINGQLTCCFCGSVEDPKSVYDMIFQIF